MPGTKRKIDEDTWIVSQSKKFKQGILLASVYETTLAQLRLGARSFFGSLLGSGPSSSEQMELASPAGSSSNAEQQVQSNTNTSPYNTPPGSPAVTDIISHNELQSLGVPLMPRPENICPDCVFRSRNPLGNEDLYGKCSYCDKLVCHLNTCRGCENDFCVQCTITKYDTSNETYECYSCLH